MSPLLLGLVFFLSFIGTFLAKEIARKRNVLDIPNERSSHTIPTPRGGGIVIAVVWFCILLFLVLNKEISFSLFFALLCGLPISAIGFFDDLYSISPKVRLSIQVASIVAAIIFLGGIESIDIGFTLISIPFIFSIVAIIGVVWFTNLFNFLDGIDGYLGSEIVFVCLSVFLLLGLELPLFLAAVTIGFLLWNWQPAKIFMGDVGSTLLGFTIGILGVYYQKTTQSSILIWLMLTSVFWFDATFTLFRRWRNKEILSVAHKKHAYQRIVQYGYSHQKTVLFSMAINIAIGILALIALIFPILTVPLFFVNIAILYFCTVLIDKRLPFS